MLNFQISNMAAPILTADRLSVGYALPRQTPRVVAAGLDIALKAGELVCLLGPNGAGKSTLIRTLAGMQAPLEGQVRLAGRPIADLSPQELAQRLSVVLTDRISVGILSARDLVALGRYPYTDWTGRLSAEDERIIAWAMRAVGAEALADRNVSELSDGERQKLLVARALAQEPELIVLDEPTAFLDLPRRVEMMGLLQRLAHTTGHAVLLSMHDLDLALRWADRIWLLPQGGPLHVGAPEDLVLNGAFESVFRTQGVTFDAETGAFKMVVQQGDAVSLVGSGKHAFWTARALERAGFHVHRTDAPPAAPRIEVAMRDGQPLWRVVHADQVDEYRAIYDLIQTLKCKA